jgi:taurine dioxygenase
MSIELEPLNPHLGARILGLNPSTAITDEIKQQLYDGWLQFGALLFPASGITPERQIEISRCFGELEIHPLEAIRSKDHPELIVLTSADKTRNPVAYFDEVPLIGRIQWHKDMIYTATPNRGALLRAVTMPSQYGETGFSDLALAYELLPDDVKEDIADLEVVYRFDVDIRNMRFGRETNYRPGPNVPRKASDVGFPDFPDAIYPLVLVHPETHKKVLNVSPLFLHHILDGEDAEGDALLNRLVDHVVSPERAYIHEWEVGEMILWDNYRIMHSARGCDPRAERTIHRTTISGATQLGRTAA